MVDIVWDNGEVVVARADWVWLGGEFVLAFLYGRGDINSIIREMGGFL